MAALTLRTGPTGKESPLTSEEVDQNFINLNDELATKLNTSSYTAADVLVKVKSLDGTGSGLDADLLDGKNSSSVNANNTIVARDSSGNFAANQITADLTGDVTGNLTGDVTGNSDTATTLQTARNINGVAFDGSQGITIADSTKVAKVGDTMTGYLTLNDDPVNDLHAATKSYVDSYGCPKGAIMLWSGSVLPDGWGLCDGTTQNGVATPDLRNRFVYGASNLTQNKNTGGSTGALTTSSAGSHSHGSATGGHALTQNQMPSHSHYYHNIRGGWWNGPNNGSFNDRYGNPVNTFVSNQYFSSGLFNVHPVFNEFATDDKGGNAAHTHTISSDGTHNHTVTPTLPPHMVLAYIIKLI